MAAASRAVKTVTGITARATSAVIPQARPADRSASGPVTRGACTLPMERRLSRPSPTPRAGSPQVAATPHELGPGRKLARRRGASLKARPAQGPRWLAGSWLFRASRSPRGRRARHAACSPAALKRRLSPHAARRVPRLSAPLPSVATPDNPRGLSAAARFGPRAAPLQVAARGAVLGPSRGLHARHHVRRPRARPRSFATRAASSSSGAA
jgi:hypothetical protein